MARQEVKLARRQELVDGLATAAKLASNNTFSGNNTFTGSTTFADVTLTDTDAGIAEGPELSLFRNSASPAADDTIGEIMFTGKNSAAETIEYANVIGYINDPTDASEDGSIYFRTIAAGTSDNKAFIRQGLVVGSPTGGDRGAGTVNAKAVYDDNVLLTDYVFDAALDRTVDTSKWNSKVPDRVREDGTVEHRLHEPARRFANRLDDLDPALYSQKWKANRRLPAFDDKAGEQLSVGEYAQRLLETCEVQAIHIDNLLARIEALEARDRGRP